MKCFLWILILLTSIQTVYGFCVYNDMADGTKIDVNDSRPNRDERTAFKKTLAPGQNACCNFKERTCVKNGTNNEVANFHIKVLGHGGQFQTRYAVDCASGGGLSIWGTDGKVEATCTDANGVVSQTPLLPI